MHNKWVYLFILSLIWGSSFILIKKGLVGLTDYQLGSLRIVLTSLFLFSVGFKSIKQIQKKHWFLLVVAMIFAITIRPHILLFLFVDLLHFGGSVYRKSGIAGVLFSLANILLMLAIFNNIQIHGFFWLASDLILLMIIYYPIPIFCTTSTILTTEVLFHFQIGKNAFFFKFKEGFSIVNHEQIAKKIVDNKIITTVINA